MTVTVLPILETDFKPEKPLAEVMNERLIRLAKERRDLGGGHRRDRGRVRGNW
ncbi:hypothetical protein [Pedobacter sp.]|uniref:hypothetical protein n=1 Tax=Pedobacter sp. TaxID=1411316 RepID=UPI003BA9B967